MRELQLVTGTIHKLLARNIINVFELDSFLDNATYFGVPRAVLMVRCGYTHGQDIEHHDAKSLHEYINEAADSSNLTFISLEIVQILDKVFDEWKTRNQEDVD